MNNVPAAAINAMAVQLDRTRKPRTAADQLREKGVEIARLERELKSAQAENQRLAAENEKLRAVALHAAAVNVDPAISGQFHEGVAYVNQVQACKVLGMRPDEQYKISRWVKANKFQMIAVPGHKTRQIVLASLHKPERGQPGRKKK